MIRELRIYLRLRPFITQLQKEMTMKFSINMIVQVIGTIVQAVNAVGSLVPPKYQTPVTLGVSVAQALVAFLAHFSNPDGTSASVAYTK